MVSGRPDPTGDLADQAELCFLLGVGEGIADLAGCEATLRAHREAIEGNVPSRLVNAGLHRGAILERAALGGEQPEDDLGSRAHVAERAEVARARGIVLEEQAIV